MMNKKGELVLRDVLFMIIIFAGIMALISVFVTDIAGEYGNTNMNTEYYGDDSVGGLGNNLFGDVNESMKTMRENLDEGVGSFGLITGTIKGVGTILGQVVLAPVYIGSTLSTVMVAMRIPSPIPVIVKNLIIFLIYTTIIFVIVSALTRGGRKL